MNESLLCKYLWFIEILLPEEHLKYSQIENLWKKAHEPGDPPLCLRTFHNHRQQLERLFGIKIKCDLRDKKREYFLDLTDSGMDRWLLKTLLMHRSIREINGYENRVLLESTSLEHPLLDKIKMAMRNNSWLEIVHATQNTGSQIITFAPYFIKLHNRCWYVGGPLWNDPVIRIYKLDNLEYVRVKYLPFFIPDDFNAADCWEKHLHKAAKPQ